MAKKKTTTVRTESSAKRTFLRGCAFIGILISAVIFVVSGILTWVHGSLGTIGAILNLIGQITLLFAVAFPAWDFVKYKKTAWKVIYWVALVIYVFGCVFGFIKLC